MDVQYRGYILAPMKTSFSSTFSLILANTKELHFLYRIQMTLTSDCLHPASQGLARLVGSFQWQHPHSVRLTGNRFSWYFVHRQLTVVHARQEVFWMVTLHDLYSFQSAGWAQKVLALHVVWGREVVDSSLPYLFSMNLQRCGIIPEYYKIWSILLEF